MKIASLYSGVGGLDWGFKSQGWDFVFANDYEPTSCATYKINFKKTFNDDCAYLKEGDIGDFIDSIPNHDILLGGFPCPSWSLAGNRLGFQDKNGKEFFNCLYVLRNKKPKIFIFENVKGLLSHDKGNSLKIMLDLLRQEEYEVEVKLFNLSDYGVPQKRERIIFFGVRKNLKIDPAKFIPNKQQKGEVLKEVLKQFTNIDKNDPNKYYKNHNYHIGSDTKLHWIKILKEGENLAKLDKGIVNDRQLKVHKIVKTIPKTMTGYRRFSGEKISPTMAFGNTMIPIHPYEDRSLSVRETAAVQGFPNFFEFSGGISSQYKQVGNAVPPIFSLLLAETLANAINNLNLKKEP